LNAQIVVKRLLKAFKVTESQSIFGLASIIELGAGYNIKGGYVLYTIIGCQYSFTTMAKSVTNENNKNRLYGMTFSIGVKYNLRNK